MALTTHMAQVPRANTSNRAMEVVREFRKLNPPMFDGVSSDPLVADHWLSEIRKLFDVLDVTEDVVRVKLVACQLSGEANEWWKSVLTTRKALRVLARTEGNMNEPNVENMTWAEFEAIFEDQYFLESFKDMLREQFKRLEQGTMTVSEYAMKFQALSRFALELISMEEKKCKRFIRGLDDSIQKFVMSGGHTNFVAVLELARNLEASGVNKKNARPPTTTVSALTGSFGGVSGNYGNQNRKRQGTPLQFLCNCSTFRAPTSSGFRGNSSRPPMTYHQLGLAILPSFVHNEEVLVVSPVQFSSRGQVMGLVNHHRGVHTHKHTTARQLWVRAHRLIEGLVLPHRFRLHRDGFSLSQLLYHHHLLLLRLQSHPLCMGTFLLFNSFAKVLFNSRASHSFIVTSFVLTLCLETEEFSPPFFVNTLLGGRAPLDRVCRGYKLVILDRHFEFDFIVLGMFGFDLILGMDWLSTYRETIDCFKRRVRICTPEGGCFEFFGE
ncbi:hypothetical protein Acr_00g0056340 [Actinidia rufa]|uniref:Retrotransposon gag domain-containing protein n=1 Tax=Actinidia rufa TaxID=165716 RepID=A0A7J0DM72_9ERIC|nr:hypothetical protein Acr_00g0056340 [Actinidia rufa]